MNGDLILESYNVDDSNRGSECLSVLNEKLSDYTDSGNDDSKELIDEFLELSKNYNTMSSRQSVSAEAYGEWNKNIPFVPLIYPKETEQEERIRLVLSNCFLFQNIQEEDLHILILAFTEHHFKKGDIVVEQGGDGDCLYLIESGEPEDTEPKHMCVLTSGDVVGELALLYNSCRAATVICKGDVTLWRLDRLSFNNILKSSAIARREAYESFLKEVEIFKDMLPYERSKLSDALKPVIFQPNDIIIQQGQIGDTFYIIESGHVIVLKDDKVVTQYSRGDYFGELALMYDEPRAATVIAKDSTVKCVYLDRRSFKRLLGPVESILQRNMTRYEEVIKKKDHNLKS